MGRAGAMLGAPHLISFFRDPVDRCASSWHYEMKLCLGPFAYDVMHADFCSMFRAKYAVTAAEPETQMVHMRRRTNPHPHPPSPITDHRSPITGHRSPITDHPHPHPSHPHTHTPSHPHPSTPHPSSTPHPHPIPGTLYPAPRWAGSSLVCSSLSLGVAAGPSALDGREEGEVTLRSRAI